MKYYLTTPIYYVNAAPHIGHTYTTLAADTIKRLRIMQGYDAILTTGTDEHGQKVERSAQAMGLIVLEPERQEAFMETIHRIKSGDVGHAVRAEMIGYTADLIGMGAEAIIAGCTEAPLVLAPGDVRAVFIDPGELLARRCVAVCLGLEPLPAVLAD